MAGNTSAGLLTSDEFPPTLLDRLPTELLDMAAGNIDKFDLLAHVNLCRVSQRVRALYDARYDDEFWRILTFMNGLGYVECRDMSPKSVSWKQIAFEVAEHADSCDGVCCGRTQLEKSRETMEMWLIAFPKLSSVALPLHEYFTNDPDGIHVTMLEFITFRPSRVADVHPKPKYFMLQDRPYLEHFRPTRQGAENRPEPLFEHPIAFRSFAVCPPIRTMSFLEQFDLPDIDNGSGVTMADVCQTIMLISNNSMDVATINDKFPWHEDERTWDLNVPGWSFRDHIHPLAFGTFGGWFRAMKCMGFKLYPDTENEIFNFVFKPRALPRSIHDFEDDIRSTSQYELEIE